MFYTKVGSIKSRWQNLSRKVLRWNRIDRDTKNITTKLASAETEEGGRNKPEGSDVHITVEPQSPSQPQQASPVITQVYFLLSLNIVLQVLFLVSGA